MTIVTIGTKNFESKLEAIDFYKKILGKYKNEQTITGDDHQLVFDLVSQHPRVVAKIGDGIKRFFKAKSMKKTNCFYVEQLNGDRVDFSITKAVNG
jgi:hypothetical protein